MFIKLKRKTKEKEQLEENQSEETVSTVQSFKHFGVAMGIVLLSLSFIITVNVKRFLDETKTNLPTTRRLDELVMILKDTQNKKEELQQQLIDLKVKFKQLSSSEKAELASSQLKKLYEQTGLLELKGKGVEMVIDSPTITSDDLLKLINVLKAAGAEGLSINNERLVTTSEIVTAGNNIVVNKTEIIPPYIVKAIGPTETIIPSLRLRGGIIEEFEILGVNLDIKEKNNLKIPAYKHDL
ncbi:MAG: DUF881 domain-containing protein [bacterium]